MHTKYIVLDEPTSGQDSEDKDQLMALLTDLNKKGMTILIISHDMDIFAEYCQRVLSSAIIPRPSTGRRGTVHPAR